MEVDELKARLVKLGFKQATHGLTPAEEEEMRQLQQKLAMKRSLGR